MNVIIIWGILAALFLVIELITVGMVSVWFLIGALAALAGAALHAPLWLQIVLFVVVSGVCFAFLYPLLNRFVRKTQQPTNADRVLGMTGVVVRDIDNINPSGAVSVDGRVWTARTENGQRLEKGAYAEVVDIQGVKLIVRPVVNPAELPKEEE